MTSKKQSGTQGHKTQGDSSLHLMSLVPDPSFTATYHLLDMSTGLHDALIDLVGDARRAYNISSWALDAQLLQYLDQPVQVKPVSRYRNDPIPGWLITNAPIDLPRLRAILTNWIASVCPEGKFGGPEHSRVLELIAPDALAQHMHSERLALFDENRRPASKLAFNGFSLSVSDHIDGKTCHLSCGQDLVFERVMSDGKSPCELLSQILWHDGFPYAVCLKLTTQTVPPRREVRLNVKASIRRFAQGAWVFDKGRDPSIRNDVNALVRWPGSRWCRVPYGRDSRRKCIDWNKASASNLRDFAGIELPDLTDYLHHMDSWGQPGRELQILSPQAASATWQTTHRVKVGLTINDKAELFEFVASCLEGIATPSPDPVCYRRRNLTRLFDEKKFETDDERSAWALANRHRLAAATGSKHIEFEFIGTQADSYELDAARREAVAFLGPEGDLDGINIGMTTHTPDQLLALLPNNSTASMRERMDAIRKALDTVHRGVPTACIVVLPNYSLSYKTEALDPKQAIRMGLALSGRLSQFLVPRRSGKAAREDSKAVGDDGGTNQPAGISPADRGDKSPRSGKGDEPADTFDIRAKVAVRDLMRQLGFVHKFKDTPALKPSAPLYGIHLVSLQKKQDWGREVLIATRIDYKRGTTDALLPQLQMDWIPYWRAQLELAHMTNPLDACAHHCADGFMLKRLVDKLKNEAPQDALLIVQSYGHIRFGSWWPGISDEGLAKGPLRYGSTVSPDKSKEPIKDHLFDCENTNLNILRIRLGDGDEVPDYFTDRSSDRLSDETREPKRSQKQGVFRADGYLLALVPKPGDTQYQNAFRGSSIEHPNMLVHTKSLSEYVLLTSDDESLALECVHRAEASRAGMVQLSKGDMMVNLPAPLHLADKMGEYIWRR